MRGPIRFRRLAVAGGTWVIVVPRLWWRAKGLSVACGVFCGWATVSFAQSGPGPEWLQVLLVGTGGLLSVLVAVIGWLISGRVQELQRRDEAHDVALAGVRTELASFRQEAHQLFVSTREADALRTSIDSLASEISQLRTALMGQKA